MWFVSQQDMKLLTPEASMSTYTFNKHAIKHHFCPMSGIHPVGKGASPGLEGVDIFTLKVKNFNGLEKA